MKKLFLLSATAAILAACSSVVPPVTVNNPIGLEGTSATSGVVTSKGNIIISALPMALTPLPVISASFNDVTTTTFASFNLSQKLNGTATVETDLTLPASFTVAKVQLDGAVKNETDSGDGTPIVLTATSASGVTFQRVGTTNTYSFDSSKLTLTGGPSDFAAFKQVITTGGRNVFTGTMMTTLSASSDTAFASSGSLVNTTITFTLGTSTGTIKIL